MSAAEEAIQTGRNEEVLLVMPITPKEAPFLVGVKGRNISLIRKCSGMLITVKDNMVYMKRQRTSCKPELATRMVLSACCGGILRWFVTQASTSEGYPFDKIHSFELLAQGHHCTLRLLRARCGHMCLMLIPDMSPDEASMRTHLAEGRKALLEALAPAAVVHAAEI
jgi:hypothetical protein